MKLGTDVKSNTDELIVIRNTKETKITVKINIKKNKSLEIDTTIPFLDHMIETLAWRSNINIGVKIDKKINLQHTISEDIGITLGKSIYELYKSQISKGVEGFGYSKAILDEAIAEALISIEGRINYFINGPEFQDVDGISGFNLVSFLEGFCQGCNCTLRLDYSGKDPHHSWEAAFRALGYAIKNVFKKNVWRKDTISALKGTLE
jgi:imidazoleglycerol-phosphate dehydratase